MYSEFTNQAPKNSPIFQSTENLCALQNKLENCRRRVVTSLHEPVVDSDMFNRNLSHHLYNDPIVPTSEEQQRLKFLLNEGEPSTAIGFTRNSYQHLRPSGMHSAFAAKPSVFQPQGSKLNFSSGRRSSKLDPNQIAARQAIPKTLPTFTGVLKEWPVFLRAYENSTRACGYSNSENLGRLLDCLKGEALEAVRCVLLHPDSVPDAMQTL